MGLFSSKMDNLGAELRKIYEESDFGESDCEVQLIGPL